MPTYRTQKTPTKFYLKFIYNINMAIKTTQSKQPIIQDGHYVSGPYGRPLEVTKYCCNFASYLM